eukprot:CAMPEP_0173394746 /NCGR_PEP_ID=MMETSP1356-20130122/29157_1 /TAXON_ID=77927 ORGANISM="Hemiselmis virescens, Strain PCC157" /NCGR_SAMPLE_ID=MMETSP1356 /ASSEMBLY_ACC=CAM_ASM_000847 /LENGTH=71 /DNA_ID=CAMNT_0014353221 /DNA_START=15 /DNA_END=230 /DNA_ORIENTATION=+
MKDAAQVLRDAAASLNQRCDVSFNDKASPPRERLAPNLDGKLHVHWQPAISLEEGCRKLLEEYTEKKKDEL